MEHIERTGVHSGDSIAVYPAWNINDVMTDKIIESSRNLAISLNTKGLVNIQYLIYENELYVIEVNPPFLPYHSLYQQGDRRSHGGFGHQGHAGRKAEGYGVRYRPL